MKIDLFSTRKGHINRERKHLGIRLLDLAIIVMCVVFVRSVILVAVSFYDANDLGHDTNTLYYRLRDQDYARLAESTWRNRMYGRENDVEAQEYYAVADYFEAAIQYRLCREAEDNDGAENWLEKMKDAESRMGVFVSEKEKIDEIIGIQ